MNVIAYLGYVLERLSSSAVVKTILAGISVLLDYIYQLSVMSKIIPVVVLFIINTIVGVMAALKHKRYKWPRFFTGAFRLLLYIVLLVVTGIVDDIYGWNIFLNVALGFVVGTEFLNILKNMNNLGAKFPRWVMDKLKELIEMQLKYDKKTH